MARPLKSWQRLIPPGSVTLLGLLLIGGLAFFWNLGGIGLIDETEPLFAEAARQMTVTGDWITPFFNGQPRFDKPPLIYWLMAIAYQTIGVNEWAARLPSALSGFGVMVAVFYALKLFGQTPHPQRPVSFHPLTPWLGAAMVAFNPYILFFSRTGYSDMLLAACMSGALLSFFWAYIQTLPRLRTIGYLAFYGLMGLAVLTKGPVGVVLPGLIVAGFLLYRGKIWTMWGEVFPLKGLGLVLAISLPWYGLVIQQNGASYVNSFFGFHNVERFTSVVNDHGGPWYFHFLAVLVGFAPWSVFLPAAIVYINPLKRRYWQQQPRSSQFGVFALAWFLGVLGFFTIATTKYFSYVMPSVPAAAILVALWWNGQAGRARGVSMSHWASVGGCLGLAWLCFFSPNWLHSDPAMPYLGLRVQEAGLSTLGAIIWAGCGIAGLILVLQRCSQWVLPMKVVGFGLFLSLVLLPVVTIVDAERQLPLRHIAQTVVALKRPGEPVIMPDDGFDKSSLVFYTRQPIQYLDQSRGTLDYLKRLFEAAPDTNSVLLIVSDRTLRRTRLRGSQYETIHRVGIYRLLRIARAGVG